MGTPLIFSQNQTPVPTSDSNKPLIFGGRAKETPALFTTPNPQITPQQSFGQKIVSGLKSFGESIKQEGIGNALADIVIPKSKQQKPEVVKQNLDTFIQHVTYDSGEAMVTKAAIDFGKEKALEFAGTNIAVTGLINKNAITSYEKSILEKQGYLDKNGDILKGKTFVETAKRIGDVAMFFPALFAPVGAISTMATGGKIINVLGKAVPLGEIVAGTVIGGSYFTLYTPNLENIFSDKSVVGEAGKNALKGMAVGALVSIPLAWMSSPNTSAFKALSPAEQAEIHGLKLSLSRRFHPNSMMPDASDDAWVAITGKMNEGDLVWLRELNNATPQKAEQMLNIPVKSIESGKLLAEKTGIAKPTEPATKPTTTSVVVPSGKELETKVVSAISDIGGTISSVKPMSDGGVTIYSDKLNVSFTETPKNIEIQGFYKGEQGIKGQPTGILDQIKQYATDNNKTITATHIAGTDVNYWSKVGFTPTDVSGKLEKGSFYKATFTPKITQAEITRASKTPKAIKAPQTPKPVEIKPKVVSVPRTQLPVGEGEKTVSRLEARMKQTLDNLSPEQIDKLGLTTTNTMRNADQRKLASEYVINHPDDALKVLQGDLEPPKGLLKNSIYVAMTHVEDLPLELATKLAGLSSKRYGQEIEILKDVNKNSPVKYMGDVIKVRADAVQKKFGKSVEQVAKDEVIKIKRGIKTPDKWDWNKFIEEIEC
jgi:hypothetical protein